jgi:hypothetical protein
LANKPKKYIFYVDKLNHNGISFEKGDKNENNKMA